MSFCTLADLVELLQVEIAATKTAAAARAIAEATAVIQNYTRQTIELVEDDELTLDSVGGTRLVLPELPVVEVSAVVEDDATLVAEDDYKLGQHGVLHRIGARWTAGIQIVTVTYSHGYATLPEDVVAICTRMAARSYQAGLRAELLAGVPGIASTSLGDYAVAFGTEQGSGGEGVLGVSAAPVLLRSEKEVLGRYRAR